MLCGCYLGRMLDMKIIARKLWNSIFDPRVRQRQTAQRGPVPVLPMLLL
jgi:hypothetical protein